MKKNFWKKLLSLVLVAALVVGTFKISDMKTQAAEDRSSVTVTTADGIRITKSAGDITVNNNGTASVPITITVNGANATISTQTVGKTDVVFVMDLSNSMKGNKLTAAKAAAVSFASGILNGNTDKVRVGVASFGKYGYQDLSLTNSITSVTDKINNLVTAPGQDSGGTNIQAGIIAAESLLANSNAVNKIIVILSDGQPTYSYQGTAVNSNKTTLNDGSQLKLITKFNNTIKGGGSNYTFNEYKINNNKISDNGVPTISESYLAKNKGITIYSIAYDVANNKNAIYTMENVASASSKFYRATSGTATDTQSAISAVMTEITTDVKESIAAAKGTQLTDEFPSYMSVDSITGTNAANASFAQGSATDTVTWNLADLGAGVSKTIVVNAVIDLEAMAEAYALSHDEFKDAAAVKMALANNQQLWIDLNKQVVLTYNNKNNQQVTENRIQAVQGSVSGAVGVPEGQIEAYKYTITYKLDGEEIQGTKKTGAGFWGEKININDLDGYTTNVNLYDNTAKTVTLNDEAITETSFTKTNGTDNVVVNYYSKLYEIKFVNDDNSELQTLNLKWGEMPAYTGNTPTKAEDNENTYSFKGWDPAIKAVEGNATYTAQYNSTAKQYTVTFMNGEKQVGTGKYTWGQNIVIPANPSRDSSDTQNFTFLGWSLNGKDVVTVPGTCQGNATYYAVFGEATRYYTVRFFNEDGKTLVDSSLNTQYEYGATVVKPTAPTKQADETYTYAFNGWDKTVTKVTADADYIATFEATEIPYTVKFLDENGTTELGSKTYKYGAKVDKPSDPSKTADATYTYDFAGWTVDGAVVDVPETVTADATYVASYSATYIDYSVTFYEEDGKTAISSEKYHYNDTVSQPAVPTKEADNTYTYTANAWPEASAKCTGNASYTASYTPKYIDYTVRFLDENGNIIDPTLPTTYHYGNTVTEATPPEKEATADKTFAWGGWTPAFSSTCKGSVDYTATYTEADRKYTIIFMNGSDELQKEVLPYGSEVSYKGNTPTQASDNENDYTWSFKGWDKAVTNVLGDATYFAQFEKVYEYYTITFKNGDDVLQTADTYRWNDSVVYTGAEPTQAADVRNTYEFSGWDNPVVNVAGNATYYAQFEATPIDYTVKFVDEDGTSLKLYENVHYGDSIVAPEDPDKDSDATYTYTFAGWTPEVATTCQGNATYKATYTSNYILYTVKFLDEDGTEISEDTKSDYHFGAEITNTPVDREKASDDVNTYKWAGWKNVETGEIGVSPTVTGDLTYQATFTDNKIAYTVTFKFENGQVDDIKTYNWGAAITVPANPSKAADETYSYTFEKWTPAVVENCAGNAIYTAQYESTYIDYEVIFVDEDGKTIVDENLNTKYHYGDMPKKPETNPSKDATAKFTYTFAGWTPEVAAVTCSAVYTATYDATVNYYTAKFFDGFNEEAYASNAYAYGTEYDAPATNPSKAPTAEFTYTFEGWKLKGDVTDTIVSFETKPVIVADIEYEAVYSSTTNRYTVTFVNDNGEAFEIPCTAEVLYGAVIDRELIAKAERQANAVAKDRTTYETGYYFGAWKVEDENGERVNATLGVPVTGDLTVYASYVAYTFGDFTVTYMQPSMDAESGYTSWAKDTAHEGATYVVREDGPARTATPKTVFTFIGWSEEPVAPEMFDEIEVVKVRTDNGAVMFMSMPGMGTVPVYDETTGLVVKFETVSDDITLYPVYASSEHLYTVTFHNYDGEVIDTCTGIHYGEAATAPAVTPSRASVSSEDFVTTYTFKGWDKDFSKVVEDMDVYAQFNSTTTPVHILPILPTAEPTPEPTAVPTAEPTPVLEEIIEIVEESETPEGTPAEPTEEPTPEPTAEPTPEVIEVVEEPETPEGTPDEEIDIDLDETPQGLPKTGVVAAGVLYGIGSACILLGSVLTSKFKKKEEE